MNKDALIKKASEENLTDVQLNAIMGSLLGDASLRQSGKVTKAISWNHGAKQHEYNLHKYCLLQEHATKEPWIAPNPGYGDYWSRLNLSSKETYHLLYLMLYPHMAKKKTVTAEYLDCITHPIALAWWYMDDGSVHTRALGGSIATNGFSEEENQLLVDWLKARWGVYAKLQKVTHTSTKKKATCIRLPTEGYIKLMELIEPYVPECLQYKVKLPRVVCPVCGKVFVKQRKRTCSDTCQEIYKKQKRDDAYQNRTEEQKAYDLEKRRAWKKAHRAEINAANREAYKNRTEEQKERQKQHEKTYREKNRDAINARKRAYRARMKDDPEYQAKLKAERAAYYQRKKNDPERYAHTLELARIRTKRPDVHEKNMEAQRQRRAKKKAQQAVN